jgi:hypothetical protein
VKEIGLALRSVASFKNLHILGNRKEATENMDRSKEMRKNQEMKEELGHLSLLKKKGKGF